MERCGWVTADPLYLAYHDLEWGVAVNERQKLFEMICLEGQQAGLSWITILKKRDNYRQCFHHFCPERVAQMTPSDVDSLMQNAGIIRHRGKIEAIINNAKALLAMEAKGENFSALVWSFVGGNPVVTHPVELSDIPTKTQNSEALSRALKQRGFKFVGATTCYAFMQACGLVNDHIVGCFCHQDKNRNDSSF